MGSITGKDAIVPDPAEQQVGSTIAAEEIIPLIAVEAIVRRTAANHVAIAAK